MKNLRITGALLYLTELRGHMNLMFNVHKYTRLVVVCQIDCSASVSYPRCMSLVPLFSLAILRKQATFLQHYRLLESISLFSQN